MPTLAPVADGIYYGPGDLDFLHVVGGRLVTSFTDGGIIPSPGDDYQLPVLEALESAVLKGNIRFFPADQLSVPDGRYSGIKAVNASQIMTVKDGLVTTVAVGNDSHTVSEDIQIITTASLAVLLALGEAKQVDGDVTLPSTLRDGVYSDPLGHITLKGGKVIEQVIGNGPGSVPTDEQSAWFLEALPHVLASGLVKYEGPAEEKAVGLNAIRDGIWQDATGDEHVVRGGKLWSMTANGKVLTRADMASIPIANDLWEAAERVFPALIAEGSAKWVGPEEPVQEQHVCQTCHVGQVDVPADTATTLADGLYHNAVDHQIYATVRDGMVCGLTTYAHTILPDDKNEMTRFIANEFQQGRAKFEAGSFACASN